MEVKIQEGRVVKVEIARKSDGPSYIHLVRGLPGAGKSYFAGILLERGFHGIAAGRGLPSRLFSLLSRSQEGRLAAVCADDYMVRWDGHYCFDYSKLQRCHAKCLAQAERIIEWGGYPVVHNTFTLPWEAVAYYRLAVKYDATLIVWDLYDRSLTDQELARANIHGVPGETIQKMRVRWTGLEEFCTSLRKYEP